MKNKKSIYILLPLVLIIWGILIYQFFSYSNDAVIEVENEVPLFFEIDYKEPDTIVLDVNHRDPFTGKLEKTKDIDTAPKQNIVNTPKINTESVSEIEVHTQIAYKGLVSDVANKKNVFMVLIDKQTFMMKQGDKENEVELINGNKESITIKHKGKKKNILLIE